VKDFLLLIAIAVGGLLNFAFEDYIRESSELRLFAQNEILELSVLFN
jgi:hypothetical protein